VRSGGTQGSSGGRSTVVDLACWLTVAVVGVLTITQAFGWSSTRSLAVAHSLTPYLALPLAAAIVAALWRGRLVLVTVGVPVAFGIAVLGAPLAFPDPRPPAAPGSVGLDVVSLNMWYRNDHIGDVDDVLAEVDADVIVFSEYTPAHQAVLTASPLADQYPHRLERNGDRPTGAAVWSRWPLRDNGLLATHHSSHDVVIAGPDGDVRLVALHIVTPFDDFDGWQSDLALAHTIGRAAAEPTLLIGDLNSSYWHPAFRRLLDAGFVDAHTAAGAGFSTSWPANRIVPPFVRLDHALTAGGLVSTDVDDIAVPGSDHRGLVVSVAPAR
jgi:endonuclease/exonuclease/phosphatase (EEP) superfamily protein YafD